MNLNLLPLDPLTKKFLDASLNNVFGFVKLIRFSWSTAAVKLKKSCVQVKWSDLDDVDNNEDEVEEDVDETEENEVVKPAKKTRQPTKAKTAKLASATAKEKNNSSLLSFFQKPQKRAINSSTDVCAEIVSKFMNSRNIKFCTSF